MLSVSRAIVDVSSSLPRRPWSCSLFFLCTRSHPDALIGYRKNIEFREQQELLTASAQDAARLSNIRYKGGVTSYLEVLTNETNYFAGELNLAQAQANELLTLVQLYQALGGGWQQ